jgi:hypothetical protein
MIVEFKRNSRQKRMNPKIARVLLAKGVIRIVSEDEPTPVQTEVPAAPIAESAPVAEVVEVVEAPVEPAEITAPSADGLDEMDREALLKMAEDLGLKIHGRTGDDKIRETLREHFK